MKDYIDSVLANQGSLSNFEVENLTRMIQTDQSISPAKKAVMISKIASKPISVKYSGDTKSVTGDVEYNSGNMSTLRGAVAKFSLRIVRNSNNTGVELPVALFLSNFLPNEYMSILRNSLVAGLTLVSVTSNTQRVRFTYSNADGTDTVDVFCNTSPYPSFLQDMNSMAFRSALIRMKTQSGTAANLAVDSSAQFEVTMVPYKDTSFGDFGGNRYPLGECEPPDQFKTNIIDIPVVTWLTPRQGLILPIIAPAATGDAASFVVNLNFQVSKFDRSQVGVD